MHLGDGDVMNFTEKELNAENALRWHEAAVARIGMYSLGLGVIGAGIGIAVAPKPPKPWVWGAVLGFAVVSTASDLFLSYRLRQLEYDPNAGEDTDVNGLGNTPRAGMVRETFAYPPGGATDGLGSLGKAQRMRAEAWKDGGKSWIDVTPKYGRKMRITHQFLGTG